MLRLPRRSLTRIAMLLAAIVVGYLLFTAVGDTLLSQRLSQDEDRLERQIANLQRQRERLEAIRDSLKTDEYIEGVARRVLGLVRPGETLIVVSSSATPTPVADQEDERQEPRSWWEELYGP